MRSQGRIIIWKDDRGFGFIAPEPAGERIFVHVRSVASRGRRPAVGDRVTFATRLDEQRRPQAIAVKFVGGARPLQTLFGGRFAFTWVGLGFLGLLGLLYGLGRIAFELLALYGIASVVTFCAYALDKSAARGGRWRTPESTLQGLALIGGWPGALLAQQWLRHKSSKPRFLALFWAIVVLNLGLVVAFHWQQDRWREWVSERLSTSLGGILAQCIQTRPAAEDAASAARWQAADVKFQHPVGTAQGADGRPCDGSRRWRLKIVTSITP